MCSLLFLREKKGFCVKPLLGENSLWGAFQSRSDWGRNNVKYLVWNIYKMHTWTSDKVAWKICILIFDNFSSFPLNERVEKRCVQRENCVCVCINASKHWHTYTLGPDTLAYERLNGLMGFKAICIWILLSKDGGNKGLLKSVLIIVKEEALH